VSERNENAPRFNSVTDRAERIAIHGKAAVDAAEGKYVRLFDKKPQSGADRAWIFRARKRRLIEPYGGPGCYERWVREEYGDKAQSSASFKRTMQRHHYRNHLHSLLERAQAGDEKAEADLREQRDVREFNRLADHYTAFVSAFDRASDENRKTLAKNFPDAMGDLARIWKYWLLA
jgi:hypothetical protein